MSKIWHNIHPDFKLNGEAHTLPSLQKTASDLIAFGKAYEIEMGQFLLDWLNENETLRLKTSGSTGDPKTISIKKVYVICLVVDMVITAGAVNKLGKNSIPSFLIPFLRIDFADRDI